MNRNTILESIEELKSQIKDLQKKEFSILSSQSIELKNLEYEETILLNQLQQKLKMLDNIKN